MPLSVGTRLGPYEIVAAIGAGGMGEVYRAQDKRLDRTVAIKILSSKLSGKAELKQRFEREARAISNLSHPHICTLHDIGHHDGIDYVVMEFLEGQTLAERLTKGALPTAQALQIGIQIADALDKAHKKGIIHRDLKPGNIMLTKSGAKLLDFGLAKFQSSAAQHNLLGHSELPTEEEHLTEEGHIVGTLHYMAPEQLEGKNIDGRTDIFALGLVLYEMITGKRAFTGSSKASLIAAILEKEPRPISEIQPMTPQALDRTIRKCLAKDPDERWQSAHDVMSELKWIAEGGSQAGVPIPILSKRKIRERVAWILGVLLLITTLGLLLERFRERPQSMPVIRSSILPPKGLDFFEVALSQDGTKLAYTDGGRLFVESLDSPQPKELASLNTRGFTNSGEPFWSPDSSTIAFFSDSKLMKVAATGGPVLTISAARNPKGGSWGRNGEIVFSLEEGIRTPGDYKGSLNIVSSDGGDPRPLTYAGSWPYFLPDGRRFLFLGSDGIRIGSVDNKEKKFILKNDTWGMFAHNHLLYFQDGNLIAQPFDPKTIALGHEARVVQQEVDFDLSHQARYFSATENGLLATKPARNNSNHVIWVNRQGKQTGEIPNLDNVVNVTISPDGQKALMQRMDFRTQKRDLWIHEIARGITSRFTFHQAPWFIPKFAWSRDGKWIYYGTPGKFYRKLSSGAGEEEMFLQSDTIDRPDDSSPDGKVLLYSEAHLPADNWDLMLLPLSGNQKPYPFLQSQFAEFDGKFSPDGKWVVFSSDKSGRYEVYVRPFERPDQFEFQVSTSGGRVGQWRSDGKELIFDSDDDRIMAVEVKAVPDGLELGAPHALFSEPPQSIAFTSLPNFNGFLFVVNTAEEQTSLPLNLITNWPATIQR